MDARRARLLVDGDARPRRRRHRPDDRDSRSSCGRDRRRETAAHRARRCGRRRAELGGRDDEHEAAAAALARLAADAAAVPLGDLLDEREAEADAAGLLGVARACERTARRCARASPPGCRGRGRGPATETMRRRRRRPRARARPRSRRRRSAARSRAGCAGRGAAAARRRSTTTRAFGVDMRADARRFLGRDGEQIDRSRCSGVAAASRRLASSTSSTRPSSSATFLSISSFSASRCAGLAPSSIETAIFMRASGERSSWLALASSERCAATSASMRAAATLKLAATAATSSAPETSTRWPSAPAPNCSTPRLSDSSRRVSRRTTG